jgi:aryl-alcohol dehydrogenase-like predicted oxidoreductase
MNSPEVEMEPAMQQRDQKTVPRLSRRGFLQAGTAALALGASGGASGGARAAGAPETAAAAAPAEYRNRRAGMSYRRLGRTGLMVSEVACGGDPVTSENYRHLEVALELGMNYLDMAPQYANGDCETAYGKLLAAAPGRREQVFLATKISGFTQLRERMYREIYAGLPGEKQRAIQERATEMRVERGVEEPGYFLTYFPGQGGQYDPAYLRVAMIREYGNRVEGSAEVRRFITESLEGSLKRVGTDYFDIVLCPHGANSPEELTPEIAEIFHDLKRAGKARFLGVSSHNDPAGILRAATATGDYDMVMMAYNVINGGYLEDPIRAAANAGVGMIGMKVAHAVATHHTALQPVPEWRVQKIHRVIHGEMHPAVKAYLWALQNPRITAVISNLWDEAYVRENLALAGRKVQLHPA